MCWIEFETGQRNCTQDADAPMCRLCPASATYWCNTATPPAADPWDGTRKGPVAVQQELEKFPGLLNWGVGAERRGRTGPERPCVICRKNTTTYSPPPNSRSVHKVCAEAHNLRKAAAQQQQPDGLFTNQPNGEHP